MSHPLAPNHSPHALEPLDDWLLVETSVAEETVGRLVLPVEVASGRVERVVVLAVGNEVQDLHAGDLVLILPASAIELRDGTKLVQRSNAIARVRD
jgi:hypothetical protein